MPIPLTLKCKLSILKTRLASDSKYTSNVLFVQLSKELHALLKENPTLNKAHLALWSNKFFMFEQEIKLFDCTSVKSAIVEIKKILDKMDDAISSSEIKVTTPEAKKHIPEEFKCDDPLFVVLKEFIKEAKHQVRYPSKFNKQLNEFATHLEQNYLPLFKTNSFSDAKFQELQKAFSRYQIFKLVTERSKEHKQEKWYWSESWRLQYELTKVMQELYKPTRLSEAELSSLLSANLECDRDLIPDPLGMDAYSAKI